MATIDSPVSWEEADLPQVYLGEHQRLKTQAAIKVLFTQLSEGDVESFLKEAQFIANLEHPHIVRVFDFDVIEDGTPFLVMSYAPYGTLRQLHPKIYTLSLHYHCVCKANCRSPSICS